MYGTKNSQKPDYTELFPASCLLPFARLPSAKRYKSARLGDLLPDPTPITVNLDNKPDLD
jgi:hypothetical protein